MFLKGNEGNLDLMEVCLTYFCFQSFDCVFSQEFVEKDKEDLRGRILSGDFIFFSYAADFWLEHSKKLSDNPAVRTEQAASVTPAVTRFYKFRSSSDKVDESILQHFLDDFRCFRDSPEVQQALAGSSIFLHRLRYGHRALEGLISFPLPF
jgi:hypothetical protein